MTLSRPFYKHIQPMTRVQFGTNSPIPHTGLGQTDNFLVFHL